MASTPKLTWKRYKGIYEGTAAEIDDYYAVSSRQARKWECWTAGQYLGTFKTMKLAKEAASAHAADAVKV